MSDQDGIDPAKVKAAHDGAHECWGGIYVTVPDRVCEPWLLADLAQRLQDKVTRVDALSCAAAKRDGAVWVSELDVALADPPERRG